MNNDTRTPEQRRAEDLELVNKLQDRIGCLFAWRLSDTGEITLTREAMREIVQHVERLTRNK